MTEWLLFILLLKYNLNVEFALVTIAALTVALLFKGLLVKK